LQDAKIATRHLDGLRIIAAGAVVVLHYSDYVKAHAAGRFVLGHTLHFNLFVDLFFVISGFVIASQYLGKVDNIACIGRFIWRRLARIYPLHLATLLFYLVLAVAIHGGLGQTENPSRYPWSDIPAQLLLLHAVDGQRLTFNFPSWSLSAEMVCYVIFPIVALVAARRRELVLAIVVFLVLGNSIYAAVTGTGPWAEWINQGGAFRALPGFNLGIACYLFRHQIARWRVYSGSLVVTLVAFILFGWLLPEMAALAMIYLIAVLAIQCDYSGKPTLLTRLGFQRWSSFTYSCYMLHIPIATVVITFGSRHLPSTMPGGTLTLLPVAILILAVASVISYRAFETPARQYLNDLFDRHFTARVGVPAIASKDAPR